MRDHGNGRGYVSSRSVAMLCVVPPCVVHLAVVDGAMTRLGVSRTVSLAGDYLATLRWEEMRNARRSAWLPDITPQSRTVG